MTKRKPKQESFSDQLRRLINDSDKSRNEICKAAKVDPSHLHRFMHGTGRLTNETIDRIVAVLKLKITTNE